MCQIKMSKKKVKNFFLKIKLFTVSRQESTANSFHKTLNKTFHIAGEKRRKITIKKCLQFTDSENQLSEMVHRHKSMNKEWNK